MMRGRPASRAEDAVERATSAVSWTFELVFERPIGDEGGWKVSVRRTVGGDAVDDYIGQAEATEHGWKWHQCNLPPVVRVAFLGMVEASPFGREQVEKEAQRGKVEAL